MNSFTFDMFYNYELAFDKNLADVTTSIRRKMLRELVSMTEDTSFAAYRGNLYNEPPSGGGDDNKTIEELNNIQKGAKAYFDTIKDFGKQTQDAVAGAFKGMEDALVKFVQTGKLTLVI